MSLLELGWRERDRTAPDQQTFREYLDFVIDGVSLWDLLLGAMRRGHLGNSTATDLIGCLGWGADGEFEANLLAELLLEHRPTLKSGRTRLYICPECGDIGCGAITAIVEASSDEVVWNHFRYENDYDESMWDEEPFSDLGPVTFDRAQYREALTKWPSRRTRND